MENPEGRPSRISRRALLGLLGGAGIGVGLAARELLEQDPDPFTDLWSRLGGALTPAGTLLTSGGTARTRVAVGYLPNATGYNISSPFDPAERYPEYPYNERVAGLPNEGYLLLREALRAWQPDGFGTASWNPLSEKIRPGDTVAIKPNLVWEPGWDEKRLGLNTIHPSTLRAVVDYVFKACGPKGRIAICEGTATADQWSEVVRLARLREMTDHLRKDHGVPAELVNLNDVPRNEALLVLLGRRSMLAPLAERTLFDLHDRPDPYTQKFGLGSYYVAPQALRADVVISLAKLKVHQATGVTLAMKNLFGLIPSWDGAYGDNRLKDAPHYSDLEAAGGPRTLYLENDTTWRTTVDLNQILLYADRQGRIWRNRQRRYLGIVDGLIAAGRDMFSPESTPLGVLVVGEEPVSTDAVASRLMGFDPRRIKSVAWPQTDSTPFLGPSSPSAIEVRVRGAGGLSAVSDGHRVVTPEMRAYSWKGHIEADDFAPPEVLSSKAEGTRLRVALKDRSGIAFARLVWQDDGRPYSSDLRLVGGSPEEGEWQGTLPSRLPPEGSLTLEVSDVLFNLRREAVNL